MRSLVEADTLDLLPLLTVLLLLLSPLGVWYVHTPLVLLCVIGVSYRKVLRTSAFWYVAATLLGTAIYFHWESADNHKYLICYWCLALCCAYSIPSAHQKPALALSSRLLIGLCMAFATLWKLLSDSYLDGSFFEYTLMVDGRFEYVARALGNVSASVLTDNRQLSDLLTHGYLRGIDLDLVALSGTPQLDVLATVVTWWTITIEFAIALLFLLPDHRITSAGRNTLLLLFGVTTYSVATIKGFGWVLMLLGMAQCEQKQWRWRLAYLAVFLLIQAYSIPFGGILDAVTNGAQVEVNYGSV